MKLTLAFLAALAAADAAEARSHRQARRQEYGYGSPNVGGSYGDSPSYGGAESSSVKPIETPSPTPTPAVSSSVEVPYVQSSSPAFETSSPPNGASSYPPVEATPSPSPAPPAGGDYGAGYPGTPEVPEGGKSSSVPAVPSSSTPAGAESSSILIPVETPSPSASSSSIIVESSSAPPAGGDYGAGYPVPSSTKTPAGVVPSSSAVPSGAVPSGGYGGASSSLPVEGATSSSASGIYPTSAVVPSGGYGGVPSSSLPVEAASSGVYPSGGAGYPTGTGSGPASSTPLSDYVTKTIYSTQIYSASSALVTKVVPVGTTCIPKGEADKTPSPSAPVQITSKIPVSEVVKTMTETLVYTVGVGSTAHGVTTKVTSTSTSTIYQTIVVTPSTPEKSAYPEGGNYPEGPVGTSTIRSTTTSTKYITVKPTPSTPSSGSGGYPVGEQGTPVKPSGGAGGEDCAVPATVTVTQKETVYVTAPVSKPTSSTPASGEYPSQPEVPVGGAGKPTPSGKYPMNNGTNPYPAGPTGFQTSTKPSGPVGTGVVPKPSETSSLPYFSFVSEVATPTPSASKTPSVETQVPSSSSAVPVYTPPAGGEYGSGYGGETPAVPSSKPVETPVVSSKVPEASSATPTPSPTPAGSGYGSGYGTY